MLMRILIVLFLIGAGAVALWWYEPSSRPADVGETQVTEVPVEEEPAPVRYPVPEPEPESGPEEEESEAIPEPLPPLPVLEESDEFVLDHLHELFSEQVLEDWLVDERIVERAVVFINSLDGPAIPPRMRPLQPIPGDPAIREDDGGLKWDPDNAARYAPLVEILQTREPESMARAYARHYRLFQEAHRELGQTEGYFNDRLVDIIDHLLATPEPAENFAVEPHEAHYRFADPELEDESWGRKSLMRMGPENADAVQEWLQEFRAQITAAP